MAQELIPDDLKQTIKETFQETLKEDVVIEVFSESGKNDQFNEAALALVKALAPLSEKLKVTFHTIGDEQSVKRNVTRSPSILIAPDKYRIRLHRRSPGRGRPFIFHVHYDGIHGKAPPFRAIDQADSRTAA